MYFGVDYYPEHWDKNRWEIDAKLMSEANINVVRLAEFSWSKLEVSDNQFDFSWLDEAIGVLSKYDIKIVLGTPTAAAPKWLMNKINAYPVDIHGIQKGFGTRRHYCPNNSEYQFYSKRIVCEMVKHYKDNKNVIAWQIDNEFGGRCFCDNCKKEFQEWLKNKYKNIDNLNSAWGTVFWSQEYDNFNDVIIPSYPANEGFPASPYNHNPSLVLDYYRFCSDSIVKYQKMQIDEIKKYTDQPVTHNLMGHCGELDYFDLGKDLDFVSWDCYPCDMWSSHHYLDVSMAHDLMRGIKNKNFWVMEQQSGPCGWQHFGKTPEPNQIRLWTYQSIAHGADAILYFRWRACSFGIEQYWYGVLDHDGIPRRRYKEIQKIGKELKEYGDLLEGSQNINDIAIIKSYDNLWSHTAQKHNWQFDYTNYLMSWYFGFAKNNVGIDVTSNNADFSKYKIVCLPAFNLVSKEFADKCKFYVENGGTIILTFRSGIKNEDNSMTEQILPGYFRELAGVTVEEFDSLRDGITNEIKGKFGHGKAKIWCDVVSTDTAELISEYADRFYKNTPAITVNHYGKGKVYYIACDLDDDAMYRLCSYIIANESIEPIIDEKIDGVEAIKRIKNNDEYYFA